MIGQMRNIIEIRRPEYVSDGYGGQTLKLTKTKRVWAHVKSASGTKQLVDGAVQNTKTKQIVIRNTDIRASDYIVLDGAEYNISDIERIEDKPFYLLVYLRGREVTGA